MLPSFASLEDFAQRRPGGHGDHARAAAALDDASTLIRVEVGADWVDTEDPKKLASNVPAVFRTVACAAARRAFDNPDGVQAESLGSHSVTYAYTAIEVFLTKAEKRLVRKAAGVLAIGTVPTTRGDLETASISCGGSTRYLPVEPQPGDPIPWSEPDW